MIIGVFVFIFGLILGSFLNVCIHRIPKGESIIKPGSHCPHCQHPVAWFDNIPLLSFMCLGGRCRHCQKEISTRYFAVELISGLILLGLWRLYGFSGAWAAGSLFFLILLASSLTDLETGFIPDKLTFPGMALGILASVLWPELHREPLRVLGLRDAVFGLLAGGALLGVLGLAGNFIFKKESMGGGDIKLLAMIGSFLGAKEIVLVFFIAPLAAIPFALYAKFGKKAKTIPYGPFLALTGAVFYLYGDWITSFFLPL